MCLAIPGQVLSIDEGGELVMGDVAFAGIRRRVCLEHVREVRPGQYVLVHVGFALTVIDEDEARRIFDLLAEADVVAELGEEERS